MRTMYAALVFFATGICSTGCTVAWNAANTLLVEPAHFPHYLERCLLQARTSKLADQAWQKIAHNGHSYSKDYQKGFKEGFADYLQNGGTGEPPPLPPRHYWDDASFAGRQAAEDWFAGFRHGSATARETGYRELIVVPASGPGLREGGQPVHNVSQNPS